MEHHPDLFDRAEQLELTIGNDQQAKPFTWIQDYPLSLVRRNLERILIKRAAKVLKMISDRRMARDPVDLLSVTSCGLMCGK